VSWALVTKGRFYTWIKNVSFAYQVLALKQKYVESVVYGEANTVAL
jgi:hypothetical protein